MSAEGLGVLGIELLNTSPAWPHVIRAKFLPACTMAGSKCAMHWSTGMCWCAADLIAPEWREMK